MINQDNITTIPFFWIICTTLLITSNMSLSDSCIFQSNSVSQDSRILILYQVELSKQEPNSGS